jgi:hypothetical protein
VASLLLPVALQFEEDRTMIDDPLEWLAVALEDDEPTIPDAIGQGWPHLVAFDEETRRLAGIADDDSPEVDWELELEGELRPRPARPSRAN